MPIVLRDPMRGTNGVMRYVKKRGEIASHVLRHCTVKQSILNSNLCLLIFWNNCLAANFKVGGGGGGGGGLKIFFFLNLRTPHSLFVEYNAMQLHNKSMFSVLNFIRTSKQMH